MDSSYTIQRQSFRKKLLLKLLHNEVFTNQGIFIRKPLTECICTQTEKISLTPQASNGTNNKLHSSNLPSPDSEAITSSTHGKARSLLPADQRLCQECCTPAPILEERAKQPDRLGSVAPTALVVTRQYSLNFKEWKMKTQDTNQNTPHPTMSDTKPSDIKQSMGTGHNTVLVQ